MPPEHRIKQHQNLCFLAICSNFANKNHSNLGAHQKGRCRFAAVTSPSNNLNHHLNNSHNNDTRALHYEHYCWEMGPTEVKDESYLSLSVGALVMVTGPSDLCSGFPLRSAQQIHHQIAGWCQCPLLEMGRPPTAVWWPDTREGWWGKNPPRKNLSKTCVKIATIATPCCAMLAWMSTFTEDLERMSLRREEVFPLGSDKTEDERMFFPVIAPFPTAKKPNSIYVKQGLKDLGIKAINWLLPDPKPC